MEKKIFHPQMTFKRWGKLLGAIIALDIAAAFVFYALTLLKILDIDALHQFSLPIIILVCATIFSAFCCLGSILHSYFYASFAKRGSYSMTDKVRQTPLTLYLIKEVVEKADSQGLEGRYR
ncbi:hypothetical protein UF64_04865 [Thalassospira sp. HJ]|uniref:hypothetical protein n=1 Tax=Thalassospira sp. HJ TaxID=1616823 RepID=UPI0005CF526C|nr:hypothetical protein [Thalassospira sp. HJ]KJE36477.1 hypothetical protein UF64_04865 [Thalassospira sp. HJ]